MATKHMNTSNAYKDNDEVSVDRCGVRESIGSSEAVQDAIGEESQSYRSGRGSEVGVDVVLSFGRRDVCLNVSRCGPGWA